MEKIKNIAPKVEKAKSEVSKKREKISIYENKVNELSKLKKNFEKIEPKGMSCVDDSIKYYMKNYLDKDEFAKSVF